VPRGIAHTPLEEVALTPRQEAVLRAVVTCYVGEGGAVGSATISHLLPTRLSSASIRSSLAELSDLGLLEQPHTSAGRVPNERGLRLFIDRLLGQQPISDYDRRAIDFGVEEADAGSVGRIVSRLLSDRTRLLGFVLTPPLHHAVLQQVSLVRVASDRILAVLISTTGAAFRRVVRDDARLDDRQLEQISALLRERVRGRTLPEVRDALAREAAGQRQRADRLLAKALELGAKAVAAGEEGGEDLVIASWLALLDQPEFRDAARLRELIEAIETRERLVEVLDQMIEDPGVRVALGSEVDEPALHRCALVAARFGGDAPAGPVGAVGVIGPSRMDYGRVMTLVGYLAASLTDKLTPPVGSLAESSSDKPTP
jgi:heat-inducible transcriptional repressor